MKTISVLESHPAAQIFPMMSGDELYGLAEDIKTNGLKDPIILLDGKILDGRNRYAACVKIGIEPTVETYKGRERPIDYVVSRNLHRRSLTPSQRAAVVAKVIIETGRRAPRGGGKKAEVYGTIYGVSSAYVYRAIAIARFSPDLFSEVLNGQTTVELAHRIVRNKRYHAAARKVPKRGVRVALFDRETNKCKTLLLDGIGREDVFQLLTTHYSQHLVVTGNGAQAPSSSSDRRTP